MNIKLWLMLCVQKCSEVKDTEVCSRCVTKQDDSMKSVMAKHRESRWWMYRCSYHSSFNLPVCSQFLIIQRWERERQYEPVLRKHCCIFQKPLTMVNEWGVATPQAREQIDTPYKHQGVSTSSPVLLLRWVNMKRFQVTFTFYFSLPRI